MLIGLDLIQAQPIAFRKRRQHPLLVVPADTGRIVRTLEIQGHKAGNSDGRTGRAEHTHIPRREVHRDRVDGRVNHLAGHGALKNQLIESELFVTQVAAEIRRATESRTRTNGLMGLLRVFLRLFELPGRVGQVVGAKLCLDEAAKIVNGLVRQVDRVGTHVGDETRRPALTHIEALIQLLRHTHRALCGKAELTRSLLLQRRGNERRRRIALALLAFNLRNEKFARRAGDQRVARGMRAGFIGQGELLDLFTLE